MARNTKEKLQGIFAPVATPFQNNENVDFEALEYNMSLYRETGLRGYLVLGSNGEHRSLREKEKIAAAETVTRLKGARQTVVVGVMYEAQRDAERFMSAAADTGADFFLVQSPSYFRNAMTDELLYRYFSTLADASPLPLLLYQSPGFTGVTLSLDLLEKLAGHGNIAGMKESTSGCDLEVMRLNSDCFHVMGGAIGKLKGFMGKGAIGGTASLANYLPGPAVELYRRLLGEETAETVELNDKLVEADRRIAGGYGVPGVKAAMNLTGFRGGIPRRPLCPAPEDQVEEIRAALAETGALSQ